MLNHSTFATGSSDAEPRRAAADSSDDACAPLPQRVGPYRIDGLLGRGGMGEVYRGYDPRLERAVAIKRILPSRQGPRARARFWREARALAAVQHPGLVRLYDIGDDAGALYLAMELVLGISASEVPRGWAPDAVAALGRLVGDALGAAHDARIVHRDVKPSNILLDPDGAVRVIDFGLARRHDDDDPLTAVGTITGTLCYMSPEQVAGKPVTPATDVFALGATLYALLVGQSPFYRESSEASVAAVLVAAYTPLAAARADVPAPLAEVIEACLACDPAARPANGAAVAAALEGAAAACGWTLSPALLQSLVGAAPAATSARFAAAPRRRTGRRLALVTGGLLAAAVGAGVLLTAPRAPSSLGPVAFAAPSEAAAVSPTLTSLRALPRRVLAVVPATDDADAAVLADATATYLGFAPAGVVPVGRDELAGRLDGDLASVPRDASLARHDNPAHIDAAAVLSVSTEGGEARARLSWYVPGQTAPFATLSASAPASDPLLAARDLARASFALFEVADAPAELPALTHSAAAYHGWLAATRDLGREHYRSLQRSVQAVLTADPEFRPAVLLSAVLDLGRDRPDDARRSLERILARPDLALPRDVSFARYLLAQLDGEAGPALRQRLRDHLERFPRDLRAQLELVNAEFRSAAPGGLRRAARLAEAILAVAPRSPAAASKLARSLSWLGDGDEARRSLGALGLSADSPDMAQVFAELALYDRDYPTAEGLFDRAREPDGQLTFYAAHMHMAAQMLGGRCWDAVVAGRSMLDAARAKSDTLGVDWTYFLWFNALLCAGRPESARVALDEWAGRTGTTAAAASYRSYRWLVDLATRDDLGALRAEAEASVAAAPSPSAALKALEVLIIIGDDAAVLRRQAESLAESLAGDMHGANPLATARLERVRRGLLARANLLTGHEDEALAVFKALASGEGEVQAEGDLFDRARWGQAFATALDDAGRHDEAETAWRRLLGLGYERLLAMDVTLAAQRRLGQPLSVGAGDVPAAPDLAGSTAR